MVLWNFRQKSWYCELRMFSEQTSMLTYILLKEQNLLSSFYDFASSLDEMEMLETKDETLNYLQRVIEMNKDSIN